MHDRPQDLVPGVYQMTPFGRVPPAASEAGQSRREPDAASAKGMATVGLGKACLAASPALPLDELPGPPTDLWDFADQMSAYGHSRNSHCARQIGMRIIN